MANLEAVVYSAIVMKDYGEMTSEEYEEFNNTIAWLEYKAGDLKWVTNVVKITSTLMGYMR